MKSAFAAVVMAVVLIFTGCSKPSPEESFAKAEAAYKSAKEAADTLHDRSAGGKLFGPALEDYENVVRNYPQHSVAERSLFMIATIRNNETHDPERAIAAYKEYVAKYPDGAQVPLAMFLTGYLYHNDLGKLDSAAAWYHRFLDRFPQHEMAASAQFELSTLGKSPADLIPQDSAAVHMPQTKPKSRNVHAAQPSL